MKNVIFNEDCFDTFSKIENKSIDYVFTSPPYNRLRNDKYQYFNDTNVEYFEFLKKVIIESLRVAKHNIFVNIQKNYYNKTDILKIIGHFSQDIFDIIIWEKTNPRPANGLNITNAYEMFLVFGELKSNRTYTKNIFKTSVCKQEQDFKAIMHPQACKYIIENFTFENAIIYDPFMGTGTTTKICKELNRNYIGSEISKEVYDKYLEKYNEKQS